MQGDRALAGASPEVLVRVHGGQVMGKRRIIAETGASQHGVATAVACARLGLSCVVFMGAEDVRRQAPNVQRMRLFGAAVHPVESGTRTLKDAMNEAIRDWVTNVRTTYYIIGSVAGPHPYPAVGFGVSTPEQARLLAAHADGVVVGSAIVRAIERAGGEPGPVAELVRSLREAL